MGLKYKWLIPEYNADRISALKSNYNLSEAASKILSVRNIVETTKVKEYLIGDYDEGFDPFLMYDMGKATERIHQAIENEEKILIYGDYDADGITSTVLMLETLSSLGANVSSYIPNRFTEGYGPNKDAFEKIIKSGITLIITVDNGIAAVDEISFANELGCDVIITDHHKIQEEIPNAYAVIHPEHPEGNYPFPTLAGVGVAFKLAHALLDIYPDFLLDLVAIGTVADLMPMVSENRIFVKQGLTLLNEDTRLGLKLLLDIANHSGIIDEQTIGFTIAPRLNAIGRIASAKEGLEFLSTDDILKAQYLAQKIDDYNIERKVITENIINSIEESINFDKDVIVVAGDNFHEGVLGIVASNIIEKYKKPTLIMNIEGEKAKGSARSVFDFNIYEAMSSINHLFTAFGGHSMAAGFSTMVDNIKVIEEELSLLFKKYVDSQEELKIEKEIDLIVSIDDISYQLLSDIDVLKPFGGGFEKPILMLEDVTVVDKIYFGSDQQYLRLIVGSDEDKLECISFKDNDIYKDIEIGKTIDLLCYLDKNNFNGRTKLQLHLIDIQEKDYLFNDFRNERIDFNNLPKEQLKLSKTYSDEANNYYKYSDLEKITDNYEVVNILDVPNKKEYIDSIIGFNPKAINLICKEKLVTSEVYKIDKERLIKLFNILLKAESISLTTKQNIEKLIRILSTNVDSLKIMIQILLELNLITISKNVVNINKNYSSIYLTSSTTYMTMQEKFYMENLFLKTSIKDINNKFKIDK